MIVTKLIVYFEQAIMINTLHTKNHDNKNMNYSIITVVNKNNSN